MQKAIWLEQMQYGPKRLAPKTLRFTSYCDLQKTAYIRNKTGKSHWISWLTLQKLLICVNHIIYGSTVLIVQHVQQSYSDICITFLGDGPKISTNVQLWKNSTDIFAKSAAFCSSVDQCTMRFPMSIDILEFHKCKKSFLAHFIVKSIHFFFKWCKSAKNFTKEKNIIFLNFFVIFLWKMLKGGSEKGEILVIFKLRYLQKKSPK